MPDSNSRLLVETELRSFSHDLDTALGELDLSIGVTRRLQEATRRPVPRRARRRRLVVALVATIAATATLAIPSARAAVTSFFEIGAVRVHEQRPPGPVAGPLALGGMTTLEAARARMPVVVPSARGFATPDEVWFDDKAGGVTSLVYRAKPGLPAAKNTDGVGLLVQEFVGDGSGYLNKYLGNGAHAERVAVGPRDGVFITGGDHFVAYEDATGAGRTEDGRLVGNALIFQRNGLTIRIEGNLPLARMVAIGASLR